MNQLHVYVYPLLVGPPSHPPNPSINVATEPQAELLVLYRRFPLAMYFTHGSVHMSVLISLFIPPTSPCDVHMSLLYACISIPALQIGSSVPFSRFRICALIYFICFSLFDLLHSVWQTLDPSMSLQMTQFGSFYGQVIFHSMYAAHLLYPFLCPSVHCSTIYNSQDVEAT